MKDFDTPTLIVNEILIPCGIVGEKDWRLWGQNMEIPMSEKPYLIAHFAGAMQYGASFPAPLGDGTDKETICVNMRERIHLRLYGSYDQTVSFLPRVQASLLSAFADNAQMRYSFKVFTTPYNLSMHIEEFGASMRHHSDIAFYALRTRRVEFEIPTMKPPTVAPLTFEP